MFFTLAWAFTLKSGVNTSIVGVAAAMTIPIEPRRTGQVGMLKYFSESLHPYVAFLILPAFAFVAAGFSLRGLSLHDVFSPVTLGVALGLFLGKQIGVFGAASLAIGLKLARRPTGAKWIEPTVRDRLYHEPLYRCPRLRSGRGSKPGSLGRGCWFPSLSP